ncbi:hypothetical protein [Piscinibacter sakaiensis]|uniref:Uncharacterized protein n=1 Tax=Piscinibacter sakaiensis TaxID=1547922 RepID=A0A0K8P8R9_PISS1|nr:hypothetical protein [Piscinibacter sakaiensis]GAP38909.1 hypothetical protein ISF6_0222 [Piscinibacter sakaiensis]
MWQAARQGLARWQRQRPPAAFAPTLPSRPAPGPGPGERATALGPPSLLAGRAAESGWRSRLSGLRDWLHSGWSTVLAETLGETLGEAPDDGQGDSPDPRSGPSRVGPPGRSSERPPSAALAAAREAFDRALDALDDWDEPATGRLAAEVRRARSLRELWHLRNEVYTRLAVRHCEHLARERLARIDAALAAGADGRRPAPRARR